MSVIKGHIRIADRKLWKNGKLVFSFDETENETGKFLKAAYKFLGMKYMKFFKMDVLSKMGMLGAELLLQDEDLTSRYAAGEIGVIMANASASLDVDRKYYDTIKDPENYFPSPALFVYTLPNIVLGEICIYKGFKGENAFFVSEDFDADFMHYYNEELLEEKGQEALISGWAEVGDQAYDIRMYLIEKEGDGIPHRPERIKSLFLND